MEGIDFSRYSVIQTLHESRGTLLCRAVREKDERAVVLKVLDSRTCPRSAVEKLRHEYEITCALDVPAAVRPLALDTFRGMPALVLEDFSGIPLDRLLGEPMAIERFLELALTMAGAVGEVHGQGIVHKDLKPESFLVDPVSLVVKLAGFGLATRSPREQQPLQPPQIIEGSLPYLSPEQTGRMNRAVDSRSDFYSLGVTFFQMLTGRLPFEARDPLEWIHCHVARRPPSPTQLVPDAPGAVALLVLKLLAKMADDRYQSARGLRHDLERCLVAWRTGRRIDPFPLGERDVVGRLQVPEKLFGREQERAALLAVFERVVARGAPEILLVSGCSGVGKSSLVHELLRPLVRERGLFLEGKFDQHARNIPYATVTQAFGELVLDLLADTEEHRGYWAGAIRDALGWSARLVTDMIPALKLLIGEPPALPEMPPTGKEQQIRRAFRDFIRVFTREDRPVVLFADDLQWTDPASLALFETIVTDPSIHHLLLVGAYRDNEVAPDHCLMKMLDRVRKAGAAMSEIVLSPLGLEHVVDVVAETVHTRRDPVRSLAALVYERTQGNPLFVIQFLTALYDEHLVRFEERDWAWKWDVARIAEREEAKDIADLLARKLATLTPATHDLLAVAACIGNQAPLSLLAAANGSSEETTRSALREALAAGLVTRARGRYAFTHDRVQQAAYALLPEEGRSAAHLRIGRNLLARLPREQWDEWIFEIVGQLDLGRALMSNRNERTDLAELNLRAGRKAYATAAYASALTYFTAGEGLLPPDGWESQYELTYALTFERARCEWLCGNIEAAARIVPALLRGGRTRVELAAVHALKVRLDFAQIDLAGACRSARIACSSLFGIELPLHPTEAELRAAALRTLAGLGDRAIEDLLDLPMITDPDVRAAIALLSASLPALYRADPNLHDLACCHIVGLTLRHGTSPFSPHGYVTFGATVGRLFDDWEKARLLGAVASRLVAQSGIVEGGATYFTVATLIDVWNQHLREAIPVLRTARHIAIEQGDTNIACFAAEHIVFLRLSAGHPLGEVASELETQLGFLRRMAFFEFESILESIRGTIVRLRGLPGAHREAADSTEMADHLFVAASSALTDLLLGDVDRALRTIRDTLAGAEAGVCRGMIHEAEHCFVSALVLARHLDGLPPEERGGDLAVVQSCREKLRRWQRHCPANFRGRYALVSAEVARLKGRDSEAMPLYEEAIAAARQNGFIHDEAISHERAAAFYRARGFATIALAYLREARGCYLRWGADAKVQELDSRLSEPLPSALPEGTSNISVRSEHLDLASVLEASQTISSVMVQEDLVHTLLRIVLQEGGAQRACLLVDRDGQLNVEAEAVIAGDALRATLLRSVPLEGSPFLPASLVDYVKRSKERVIIDDTSPTMRRFASDPYFAHKRPRSMLCLPILRQAEAVGVLYLENELATGGFTPERLAALGLIASQAAISLENARLLEHERSARASAEAAERRSAFLAQSSVLLSENLDYEDTLARLVRLCVRSLADWCVIDLVEGTEIRRVSGAHADPTKDLLLHELQHKHPATWHSPHPAAVCMRAGRPVLLEEITEAELGPLCEDEDHHRIIRALGTASALSVPLLARGAVLGALTICSRTPRRYGRADLDLMQEVAHRAAIAVENARLYRKALKLSEAERRQAEAEAANRTKDAFLAMLSHELRSPLAPILMALHVVRASRGSDSEHQLNVIERQARRLSKLVDDLLDVSRIGQGKITLDLRPIEISSAVVEAIEAAGPLFEERGHELTLDIPPAGLQVEGDRGRLTQVFANLLTNAAKYTEPHGHVSVSACRETDGIVVRVRDDGIGIRPDLLPRIFDLFVQDQQARSKAQGGLGIGLSLVQSLVKLHGGRISAESELGKGSTFTVRLPAFVGIESALHPNGGSISSGDEAHV